MDSSWWTLMGTTFVVVFVAELGDKTQLAALGLATAGKHPWAVFMGSAAALVLASALAVGAGRLLADRLDPRWLHYGGAVLFLTLGVLMLARGPEAPPQPPTEATQPE
jgi:putative Ca2+/H+ antiporter (TMEM165/GDT1 family)